MDPDDVQLRVLASGILFRASLRALSETPTAEQKMRLHARVEEAAWALPADMLAQVAGRDVDEGVPDEPAWHEAVARLAGAT